MTSPDHLSLVHLSIQALSVPGAAAAVGGGPNMRVHGLFVVPWRQAGARARALVAGWATGATWAPAAAATPTAAAAATAAAVLAAATVRAAVLAVTAAFALAAGVVLGPRAAEGLSVGDGRALCLGVHGRSRLEGQEASSSSPSRPAFQRPRQALVI